MDGGVGDGDAGVDADLADFVVAPEPPEGEIFGLAERATAGDDAREVAEVGGRLGPLVQFEERGAGVEAEADAHEGFDEPA
jgi:hypothetical protein